MYAEGEAPRSRFARRATLTVRAYGKVAASHVDGPAVTFIGAKGRRSSGPLAL